MAVVPDIVEAFVAQMDFSSKILSINGAVIEVKKVFHARIGSVISLDATDYTVVAVDYSAKQITVSTNVAGNPAIYSIPAPAFFHGTPYATNSQWSKMKTGKFPCIYLMEVLSERRQGELARFDTVADLRLFFLDVANKADWSTDQHYSNVILPMQNLSDEFVRQARKYKLFGVIEDYDNYAHVKFGQFQDFKGHTNSLFNESLSGIENRIEIPMKLFCDC